MLRTVIQRPIAISMLFLALMIIGITSFKRLPVDLLPSITYPRLTVVTVYEDIPAEDVERLVTRPIEEVVTALTGVRGVVSRSREGASLITVEYEWGTEMDFANLHLREAIDRIAFRRDFPEDAERPVILRWDPTSRPISILVLEGSDRIEALTDFADEVVKPALEQVDGISQAEVVGGTDREILVEPEPYKLSMYGIEIEDIRESLRQSNVSFPGGKIRQGPLQLSLRIAGEFEHIDEIAETEIIRPGQTSIRISDVARVIDTTKEPEGHTLIGSIPAVSLLIYKEPEANTLKVSEEVDKSLGALAGDYGDFAYRFVYRDADYVRASFEGLVQSLVVGAVLAFLVLFLFLRDGRSPVVVGIAIPVSIAITFGLLHFGNVKLNLMSLGGLSLAAGMLVDNSIVVLENINRHLRESWARRQKEAGSGDEHPVDEKALIALSAERGTREVGRAVFAATLTTVAVFFPVVYVPGIAGAFFRDQALTVTFSLLVSVGAALLLQPMLSARVLRPPSEEPSGIFQVFQRAFDAFGERYHRALVSALGHPRLWLVLLAVGLTGAGLLASRLDKSLMPERSAGDMRLEIELPAGTPLEETTGFVAELAGEIEADPAVRNVFSQVGRTERTLAAMQEFDAPNTARIRIILEPSRGARARGQRLQEEIVRRLESTGQVDYAFREEGIGLGELLSGGEARFSLGVTAEEADTAVAVAGALAERLQGIEGLSDIRVDRVLGTTNLVVQLDRDEILRSGLDPERVARELKNRISGVEATTFNEVEQRIDISVRLPLDERRDLGAALDSPIEVQGGRTVALRAFLNIREDRPVRELVRRNQRRMVSINADVQERSLDAVWSDVTRVTQAMPVAPGVIFVPGGERGAMQQSFRDLGWAMLLALLLVYMILAAQFESFLDPFLIAAVIPIGLAGSTIALSLSGISINILSLIGMVAFLGIAVNDAIVKVDTIRRLRRDGMPAHAAVLEASRLRLRPILMTSVTTVFAMIPMAIGLGSGEQLQRPLAITIIGGLTLTTALTLFYTPILYEVAHRVHRRRGGMPESDDDEASPSASDPLVIEVVTPGGSAT